MVVFLRVQNTPFLRDRNTIFCPNLNGKLCMTRARNIDIIYYISMARTADLLSNYVILLCYFNSLIINQWHTKILKFYYLRMFKIKEKNQL